MNLDHEKAKPLLYYSINARWFVWMLAMMLFAFSFTCLITKYKPNKSAIIMIESTIGILLEDYIFVCSRVKHQFGSPLPHDQTKRFFIA